MVSSKILLFIFSTLTALTFNEEKEILLHYDQSIRKIQYLNLKAFTDELTIYCDSLIGKSKSDCLAFSKKKEVSQFIKELEPFTNTIKQNQVESYVQVCRKVFLYLNKCSDERIAWNSVCVDFRKYYNIDIKKYSKDIFAPRVIIKRDVNEKTHVVKTNQFEQTEQPEIKENTKNIGEKVTITGIDEIIKAPKKIRRIVFMELNECSSCKNELLSELKIRK